MDDVSTEVWMQYATNMSVAVYQVLDQVTEARIVPPGATSTIHGIIDDLRTADGPRQMIEKAEQISILLLGLQWASKQRDDLRRSAILDDLRTISLAWMGEQIGTHFQPS